MHEQVKTRYKVTIAHDTRYEKAAQDKTEHYAKEEKLKQPANGDHKHHFTRQLPIFLKQYVRTSLARRSKHSSPKSMYI
jgi:hypothetical protein